MLNDKTGLILGIANKRSIAWAIAKAADREGARLVLTYQNERLLKTIVSLAEELTTKPILMPCDVTDVDQVEQLFTKIGEECGHLDFLVHALAFAKKEELVGAFHATSLEGWRLAMEISAYSLPALTRSALPLMEGRRASILTLSYLGGTRVVPHYNVMGVAKSALESSVRYLAHDLGPQGHRVNAISAGPIKTLAAAGITGFSRMMEQVASRAPMGRNVELTEVADAAIFLLSSRSSGITGEVLHVDAGYHVMGV